MKFRVIEKDPGGYVVGPHYIEGVKYVAGDVIETDDDLVQLFANKFERVSDEVPASNGVSIRHKTKIRNVASPPVVSVSQGDGEGIDPTDPSPTTETNEKQSLGSDVSEEFPNADLVGFKICFNSERQRYVVVDMESEEVLKRFKNSTSVDKFLQKQLD